MAQADMFLKLTNIKGEALDSKHKDEIEVLSWSFGASQSGSAHGGTGSGTGKVSIQDLTITHYVDQASTDLLKHLTNGKHIDEGMLTVRKAGGTTSNISSSRWTQVMVTHISNGGGAGQDRVTENVTLNFRKFTQTYTRTGRQGQPQAFLRVHLGYRRVVGVTAASSANATAHVFDFLDVRSHRHSTRWSGASGQRVPLKCGYTEVARAARPTMDCAAMANINRKDRLALPSCTRFAAPTRRATPPTRSTSATKPANGLSPADAPPAGRLSPNSVAAGGCAGPRILDEYDRARIGRGPAGVRRVRKSILNYGLA